MSELTFVQSAAEADDNIRRYPQELASSPDLAARVRRVRAWYGARGADGAWLFGSSKFVGYAGNSASRYFANDHRTDGRETEPVLKEWFEPVDESTPLGREMRAALEAFLSPYGAPNKRSRINIRKGLAPVRPVPDARAKIGRISSRPDVCAGRPCIRDTRVRVSDVLDMLAAGASAQDILADYAYLTSEDISAALAYAALATDHVVVRAA